MYDDAKHLARSADASRDTVATKRGNTSNYRANRTRVNGQYHPRMVFDITAALFVLNEEEEDAPVSDADDDVVAVNDEEFDKELDADVDDDGDNTNHAGNIPLQHQSYRK